MGEGNMKKYRNLKNIILPSNKINIFVVSILFLGIIAGSLFGSIINLNDKNLVIDKIKLFVDSINLGNINTLTIFKNSLSINLLYVILIWILGLSLLGIILNIFILFIRSFIFGFTIAAFIITYSYKGLAISLLYLIFGDLLNIIVLLILTIYSIMLSLKLLSMIFKNKTIEVKKMLKNYLLILFISILVSIISSLSESFILPALIKLIIKLYV